MKLNELLKEIENELRDVAESMPGELTVYNRVYYRTLEAAERARSLRSGADEELPDGQN